LAYILHVVLGVEGNAGVRHKILYQSEVLTHILWGYAKYVLTCNCDSLIQSCERLEANASRIHI
jgi:hypothetical protein